MSKMDIEQALGRLRSFAALTSIQLNGVEASVTVARGDLRLVVTNQGGRLMAQDARDTAAVPQEKSPEEIGAWLMSSDGASTPKKSSATSGGGEGRFASLAGEGKKLAFIGVMLVGIVVMGWFNFAPRKVAEGIVFIDHPVRVAGLNQQFLGRYGDLTDPSQVVFVVEEEQLRVHLINAGIMEAEPLRVMSFRYGSRGLEEVMVAENGAVIERDTSGNLVYSGTTYPRIRS